jgi:hypothetical protein
MSGLAREMAIRPAMEKKNAWAYPPRRGGDAEQNKAEGPACAWNPLYTIHYGVVRHQLRAARPSSVGRRTRTRLRRRQPDKPQANRRATSNASSALPSQGRRAEPPRSTVGLTTGARLRHSPPRHGPHPIHCRAPSPPSHCSPPRRRQSVSCWGALPMPPRPPNTRLLPLPSPPHRPRRRLRTEHAAFGAAATGGGGWRRGGRGGGRVGRSGGVASA